MRPNRLGEALRQQFEYGFSEAFTWLRIKKGAGRIVDEDEPALEIFDSDEIMRRFDERLKLVDTRLKLVHSGGAISKLNQRERRGFAIDPADGRLQQEMTMADLE